MAITVANLTAQIGADLTQFKMGLNEVDARLNQADSKAVTATHKVNVLIRRAQEARATATAMDAEITALNAKIARGRPGSRAQTKRIAERDELLETQIRTRQRGIDIATQAADLRRDTEAATRVANAYAARLAENAREHQVRAFNAIGSAAQKAGEFITAAFVGATYVGSNYNAMMMKAAHNTSLTAEGVAIMREQVGRMGAESGADLDQMAEGFRRVENFSFGAADAAKITEVAMRSAVGAGADMAPTAELLAKSLVQFHIGADRANDAMNVMHVAANLSSLELSQLIAVGGQTYSMASSMGVGFVEANAALVTFTKAGLNAHESMTQFRNDLNKLTHPTDQVKKLFGDIASKSGVNLAKTFSLGNLQARGLTGSFKDVRKAADNMGVSVESLANVLFPNLRGTIGAMILSSDRGFNTFEDAVRKLNNAFAGLVDPTTKQYEETLKLTDTQIKRVKNNMILLGTQINTIVAPSVIQLTDKINAGVRAFLDMDEATQKSYIQFGVATAAALLAFAAVSRLTVGIASLTTALMTLTGTATAIEAFKKIAAGAMAARVAVLAFASAWAPWLVGGAVAGTIAFGLVKWFNRGADAADEMREKVIAEATAHAKGASEKQAHAQSIANLIARYDQLKNIKNPTVDDKKLLQHTLNEISMRAPEYITGYTALGQAIGLIGDHARRSKKALDDMNKSLGMSLADQERAKFTPERAYGNALERFKQALEMGNQKMYQAAIDAVKEPAYVPGTSIPMGYQDTPIGKRTRQLGINLDDPLSFKRDENYRFGILKTIDAELARIQREDQAMQARVARLLHPETTIDTGIGQPLKPPYYPPEDADKTRKKSILDQMKDKILALEEGLFTLGKNKETADVDWLNVKSGYEKRISAISRLADAYKEAAGLADIYATAVKNADSSKEFTKAIAEMTMRAHKPKSERLEDIALFQVGDPDKDVWGTKRWFDRMAPGGGRMRTARTLTRTEGQDPSMARWDASLKRQYIQAAAMEQARRDEAKAVEQYEKMLEHILKPMEKQKSIYEQTIDDIQEQTELYDMLGVAGTVAMASIAQWADDTAEANKRLRKHEDELLDNYIDKWKNAADATEGARLELLKLDYDFSGFGQSMTDEAYAMAAAIDMFGQSLYELDPLFYALAVSVGAFNKQIDRKAALKDYNSQLAEMRANIDAVNMTGGGDFQKWLMRKTGQRESYFANGAEWNHLSLDKLRDLFNTETTSDQANTIEEANKALKQRRVEMGLIQFRTTEARIAWELFGKALSDVGPEMRAQVKAIADETDRLNKVDKAMRVWQDAAGVLEDSFTQGFEAILSKEQSFWEAFTETFKTAVARLLASEAAKEIVRFIGRATGITRPESVEGGNGQGFNAMSAVGTVISALGGPQGVSTALGVPGPTIAPGGFLPGIQQVFIVGASPMVMAGGIPGIGGKGGTGGGSFATIGSLFGPTGTIIGAGLDIAHGFGLFADGGRPGRGQIAIVGERGPEVWVPDEAGTIYNGRQWAALTANNGTDDTVEVKVVNTGDNHYYGDLDAEMVSQKTANKVVRRLRYGRGRRR